MDCERVQDLLSDHLEGTLPGIDQAGVASHLAECLRCRMVKEGLEETILRLRNLPPRPAPPDLLEGIRSRIAREEGGARPLWKKRSLPAYVKIPLEAAAAVVLFLLVYGTQRAELVNLFFPRPTATPVAAPAVAEGTVKTGREAAKPREAAPAAKERVRRPADARPEARAAEPMPARRKATREVPPPDRTARSDRDSGRTEFSTSPAPQARPSFPLVPAQRVSTAGERIEYRTSDGEDARDGALPRMFPPPPSLLQSFALGRELTIEVTAENRPGLEDRIALAAARFGGSARGLTAMPGTAAEGTVDTVRCRVPASSAKHFLEELARLGTIPEEGQPGWSGSRAGLSPIAYTVRIRVR